MTWLFRETLAQGGVGETQFEQFNTYLADHGLQARGGELIDLLIVLVAKQRKTREEKASIKADKSPIECEFHSAKRRQIDTDASYNVNRRDNHYGYKNHVNVDKQDKLIRRYCEASLFERLVRFGLERRSG